MNMPLNFNPAAEPFVSRVMPVAQFSWEVEARLAGAQEATAIIPAEFRQPVVILGVYPSVVRTSYGALVVPTVNDLKVEMNSNEDTYWTQQRSEVRNSTGPGATFVALGSLSLENRALWLPMRNAAPDLSFRFAWRNWLPGFAETPLYEDCIVGLTMFCAFPGRIGADRGRGLDAGGGAQ